MKPAARRFSSSKAAPDPDPEAWRGADPGQGVRPQPVRAVHPPGPFAGREVPADISASKRSAWSRRRRGASSARAMRSPPRWVEWDGSSTAATPNIPACRRRRCNRSRPALPWELLGAVPEMLQTAWGSLFKSLRLEGGRAFADPRRHDLCRSWRPRQSPKRTAPSSPRRRADPIARNCSAQAGSIRCSSIPGRSPSRCREVCPAASTRCSNWSARRHCWIRCAAPSNAVLCA